MAKIIKNQGWRAPITVSNRSGFVVCGHGRLLAAQYLGVSAVPVDRQDYDSEAEEWADLISDNRIAELSEILYGWKPGAAHRFYGGRKQGTVIDGTAPSAARQDDNGALLSFTAGLQTVTIRVPSYEVLQSGDDSLSTSWRFDKPLRNGDHPTMKLIGLCARAIQNLSRPGEIVADFFGRSGSTLVAAEQTGRECRTMELDSVYCDVIVKRWEEFSGQKAKKLYQSV